MDYSFWTTPRATRCQALITELWKEETKLIARMSNDAGAAVLSDPSIELN